MQPIGLYLLLDLLLLAWFAVMVREAQKGDKHGRQ